jgi:hypothetical protein
MDIWNATEALAQSKAACLRNLERNHLSANRQWLCYRAKTRSDVEYAITQIRSAQVCHPAKIVLIRTVSYIEEVVIRTVADRSPMDIPRSRDLGRVPG